MNRATETLNKAKHYFLTNGLLLNSSKTKCIFIGSRHTTSQIPPDTVINLGNTTIQPSESVKNLGLYLDTHMTFEKHINEISKKVMSILLYINRIKDNFDKPTMKTIVQTLALSIMNYCSTIWGSANDTQLERIQKLQNFAAKIIDGKARKFDHVTPINARITMAPN